MENVLQQKQVNIGVFGDGGDLQDIRVLLENQMVDGLTTNPSLLASSGVSDYRSFGAALLEVTPRGMPVSFEVLSDDREEIIRQAQILASWSEDVYVKIPIVNSRGESLLSTIAALSKSGVKVNVTAVMTTDQSDAALAVLDRDTPSFISVFAGRIADTGRDPTQTVKHCVDSLGKGSKTAVIWASAREIYNAVQAASVGCHYITLSKTLIDKVKSFDKNLDDFSRETAKMFIDDAIKAGLDL